MLCAGNKSTVNKSLRVGCTELGNSFEVRAVGLVCTSPTRVYRLSNTGREVPHHMAELCFVSCYKPHLIGKFFIVCSALSDVVREVYCVTAVIYAVNIVLTVDVGNTCLRLNSCLLKAVNGLSPCIRVYTADSGKDTAVVVGFHILLCDVIDRRLYHLCRFLLQSKCCHYLLGSHGCVCLILRAVKL